MFKKWSYTTAIVKWFKKCGFGDNTTKNFGEELFGTYVWWLWDNNNKIDFNIVAKKVLNHSINLFIDAENLLKASDDAEVNWHANTCDIIENIEEK